MKLFRKTILAAALGAAALTTSSPALADRWRGHRHDGGDDAAIAIGAGVVGLALGAAIASNSRDRYYDRVDYYYDGPRYREYYYYRDAPRYRRYYDRPHYRRGHDRGWHRGHWRDGRGYGRGW